MDEDFPGFMCENWFTNNEFEEFCAELPTLYSHMVSGEGSQLNENTAMTDGSKQKGVDNLDPETNQKENVQEFEKGENTDCGKKVESENALVESPTVFEPSDVLRVLVLYSPYSSQEKQITVLPSISCENNDTPAAVEEIPTKRKNDKEKTVTLGRKLKIKVRKERSSLQNKTNDRAAEEETIAEPKTTTSASGGKNKKGSFTINDDGDDDFEETLPRKSPRKVIDGLSNARKEWVSEVGFGPLLSFSLRIIPHEIGINVIWWFDHLNYEMSLGKDRKIKIGEEDVNDILGLPRDEKEVEYKTDKKKDDEKVKEWREKFPMRKDDSKITEKMIFDAIGRSEDADLFFKQNCMVLMTNLFFLYLDRITNDQIKVERSKPVYIAWKTSLIAKRSEVETSLKQLKQHRRQRSLEKEAVGQNNQDPTATATA
ncbi:hypothetical protein POM88_032072 [Heracleum sosnowskyi]|uniref:Uncharacterized protein n=1 Tax=Heracleum sosnowskyi TaxID=360622 RepID=A0AAD8HYK1_9APIA|nr:hypothetical protein POM88_032072 [Heracleum sosnowskyi]